MSSSSSPRNPRVWWMSTPCGGPSPNAVQLRCLWLLNCMIMTARRAFCKSYTTKAVNVGAAVADINLIRRRWRSRQQTRRSPESISSLRRLWAVRCSPARRFTPSRATSNSLHPTPMSLPPEVGHEIKLINFVQQSNAKGGDRGDPGDQGPPGPKGPPGPTQSPAMIAGLRRCATSPWLRSVALSQRLPVFGHRRRSVM